jgi:putative protein-disulfide isomerase
LPLYCAPIAALHVSYYTDPACPISWAAEPALRRLEVQFGEELAVTYVMYGRARQFERPLEEARAWLDAAESGMPVDPRLWHDDPPSSSYPACLAVKAAAEQGLAGPYLRVLREGFACERRRLDNADALVGLASAVPALDAARFRIDLQSHASVEAFGTDLERARADGRRADPALGDPRGWGEAADRRRDGRRSGLEHPGAGGRR